MGWEVGAREACRFRELSKLFWVEVNTVEWLLLFTFQDLAKDELNKN